MTSGILTSKKQKESLHKIYLKERTDDLFRNYKRYRNVYNSVIRLSKKLTIEKKLLINKKKPKQIWQIYNELTTGKFSNSKIKEINVKGHTITDEKAMAEEFNNFFTSVGSNIANSISKTNTLPQQYLKNDQPPPLVFDSIHSGEILAIINSLEPKCSTDIHGICPKLIKFVSTSICIPLAHIFTLSLKNGVFPEKLKLSRVVPIFKSGDTGNCNNYRPIALISTFAKIIEKIVSIKLTNHIELNKLLCKNQFGFQRGLSTEHCILHLTNYVTQALNENKYAIGIFLDLQKAFDVVDHSTLMTKLKNMGVGGVGLAWFESYLSNRCQVVDINGKFSSKKTINISVMQGSVLGPLLFLIFINDLPNASEILRLLLFADDTCALDTDQSLEVLIPRVNAELQKVANWFVVNKISVNVTKCKYIIFKNQRKKIPSNLEAVIFNSNEINKPNNPNNIIPLERIHSMNQSNKTYKYLGILIDENLNFNSHVNQICSKLSRALFCLNRVKHKLNSKSLRTLYFSLFHSHLLYCNIIFNMTSQTNLNKISILQKKAIRTITKSAYNAHTANLFTTLSILPFEKIIKLKNACFMHSIYFKNHHHSFNNVWSLNLQRELDHTLRNQNMFYLPFPRSDHFKKSPLYLLPKFWNDLPAELKCLENPFTFKIATQNYLLSQVEVECLLPP